MRRRSPDSKRCQREFAESFATDFDAAPVHNHVWETVDADDQLAALCDAAAAADAAGDLREDCLGEDVEHAEKVEEAADRLHWVARQRALEVVAEACATVINDAGQWVADGIRTAEEMEDATFEAREWLQLHTNEAARVGVLEGLGE